jgi:hypothetical protein
MSSIILTGDTSGTLTVSAPLVAGSNTLTLAAATGTLSPLVSATAQASTSGTSIDFTSIPSWAKRVTVMFNGVSTNGTTANTFLFQLGDSGGVENTGYSAYSYNPAGPTSNAYTTGFGVSTFNSPQAAVFSGHLVITNVSSNIWVASGVFSSPSGAMPLTSGSKTLSDVLTQIRITSNNGTDTFDAGSINIMWE